MIQKLSVGPPPGNASVHIDNAALWCGVVFDDTEMQVYMVGIPADQNSLKMEVHRQYMKSCILNIG